MKLNATLNMKLIFKSTILLSTVLFTACMQSTVGVDPSGMPKWVQSEPEMYPHASYLSATGVASAAEQAKARALSNLAKIFQVQIRDVSTTLSDTRTNKKAGIETVQQNQRFSHTVNLNTDKMVQDARIAEQWQSHVDLSYHALAVLDRAHAGNNIRGEIRRLDTESAFLLEQQAGRTDILLKIADFYKANTLQRDRLALQQTLKIIDASGQGVPARWNLADLDEQLQRALRSLPLQAMAKVDDVGGLNAMLQAAVAKAGFELGDAGYQLAASLVTEERKTAGGWHWLRATLKLELIARDGETVLGYQAWPLKVSANDASQLLARMRMAVDKKLQQELLDSMLAFAS